MMSNRLIFLYAHPIQYFAPMLAYLECSKEFESITAWYCSTKGVEEELDHQFGVNIKWDIPLLNGYHSVFLKNYSKRRVGFFSLVNWGVIKQMIKEPPSIIVVHGWGFFTNFLVLLLARFLGHKIAMRGESPLSHELKKPFIYVLLKRFFFSLFIFPNISYFLYIGTQNLLFYKYYKVPDNKLFFTPYSVDNDRFRLDSVKLKNNKTKIKESLNIPLEYKVVLYCGKYMPKKRPFDLIEASLLTRQKPYFYVFMGEGGLRPQMEEMLVANNLHNILLTGFVNQSKVSEFYAIADLFVMCSEEGETWGLATNEAMNFGIPVLISNKTGCSDDLVVEGKTGYTFKTGDVIQLAERISTILELPTEDCQEFRRYCVEHIELYSYATILKNLKGMLKGEVV